jgi:uncharacterized SAM-binding protein YcdF (DUF218 family)
MLERVRYAAWLQKRTSLPIIVSGGSVKTREESEAKLASQVLKQEFSSNVLSVEERSRNTWENAQFTSSELKKNGINKIALVTHTWHMPRAMHMFKKNRIDVIAAPTIFSKGKLSINNSEIIDWLPRSKAFRNSGLALHEYIGMYWYQAKELIGI